MAYSILSAVIFGFNPLLARLVYAGGGNAAVLALYRMVIGSMLGLILHRIFEKGSERLFASSKRSPMASVHRTTSGPASRKSSGDSASGQSII